MDTNEELNNMGIDGLVACQIRNALWKAAREMWEIRGDDCEVADLLAKIGNIVSNAQGKPRDCADSFGAIEFDIIKAALKVF
jgi:hypothetical protein